MVGANVSLQIYLMKERKKQINFLSNVKSKHHESINPFRGGGGGGGELTSVLISPRTTNFSVHYEENIIFSFNTES